VLRAAGLADRFPVVVDGVLAAEEGLPGKPDPATYEYAARLLDLPSEQCVVVEDAVSGVQAGSAGSFHSVIGVDRGAGRQTLLDAGATLVVNDLEELLYARSSRTPTGPSRPDRTSSTIFDRLRNATHGTHQR
jgi:beta-phosphoglucomutase-like phosphatase (HAD superfamily)